MLMTRDNFTPWPVIGGNETLLALPLNKWNLDVPVNTIDNVLPQDYQLATGIMHALGMSASRSPVVTPPRVQSSSLTDWPFLFSRAGEALTLFSFSETGHQRGADQSAVTFAWLASTTALAASGEWHAKSQKAWAFNRWAWGSEKLSMVFCIVPVCLATVLAPPCQLKR